MGGLLRLSMLSSRVRTAMAPCRFIPMAIVVQIVGDIIGFFPPHPAFDAVLFERFELNVFP